MSFMQNVRAGNAGAGIGLDAAPYGTRPDGTEWTYSKWSNRCPNKINLIPPPPASTPSRKTRKRKVSLAKFKKAAPQPEQPVLVPLPTRCSRCEHFHDEGMRVGGWHGQGFVTGGDGVHSAADESDVDNAPGFTGPRYLPECSLAAHRHPRRACRWFVDFEDLGSVEKTKRAKKKKRAGFGLCYVAKPASLAERVFAATAKGRAYLGPAMVARHG